MSQKLSIKNASTIRKVLWEAIPEMKKQSFNMGVCHAVSSTKNLNNHKEMTKAFICVGLEGHGWVTGWLSDHSPEYKEEYRKASLGEDTLVKFQKKVRQYRLDWIDHMIGKLDAYIESKGKTSL